MDQLNVVSLDQAKLWLRVDLDYDYEDTLITALIKSAVNQVEQYTLQVLWQRSITEITDRSGNLKIYNYPIIAVEDVVDKDFEDVEDAVKKFLKPVERHLFDIGAQDEVLDMIVAVHEMIDPIITPKNEQV